MRIAEEAKCLFNGGSEIGLSYPPIVPRKSPRDSGYAPLFNGGVKRKPTFLWDQNNNIPGGYRPSPPRHDAATSHRRAIDVRRRRFSPNDSTCPPSCRRRQAGRRRRRAATATLPLPTPPPRSRQAAASAAKLADAANAVLSPSCHRRRQAGRCPRGVTALPLPPSFQLLSSSLSSLSFPCF